MGARRAKRQSHVGRVVLVDPAFRDERVGHHARLNQGYAELLGPERCWLAAHRSIDAVTGMSPDRVVRAFAVSFYDSAEQRRLGRLMRLLQALVYQDLPWVPRQARAAVQSLRHRRRRPAAKPATATAPLEPLYLEELTGLVDSLGLGPDDHLVFTSLDAQMGRSILELQVQRGLADLPSLHLRLMYDDETAVDGGMGYAALLERLAATGGLGRRLKLYCETRPHAVGIGQRLGMPVGVAPYPAEALSPPSPEKGRKLTVAFLGEAREEKGIGWLPDIVAAFERRYPDLTGRVEWLVHAGGRTIEAATARDRLRAVASQSGPAVTYHFGSTTRETYRRHLTRTDVVLALQDPAVYARRGSGVAQEAVAAGRPLICRAGTSMAQEAGEATLVVTSPEDVADAVARIAQDPAHWFARAAVDARRFHRMLGRNDLVRDCAASLTPGSDAPVAMIAAGGPPSVELAERLNAHAQALTALGYQVVRVYLVSGPEPAGASLARAFEGNGRDLHTVASFEVGQTAPGEFAKVPRALRGLLDGSRLQVVLADDAVAMHWISLLGAPTASRRHYSRPADEAAPVVPTQQAPPAWRAAPVSPPTGSGELAKLRRAWRRQLKPEGPPPTPGSRPTANRV